MHYLGFVRAITSNKSLSVERICIRMPDDADPELL